MHTARGANKTVAVANFASAQNLEAIAQSTDENNTREELLEVIRYLRYQNDVAACKLDVSEQKASRFKQQSEQVFIYLYLDKT